MTGGARVLRGGRVLADLGQDGPRWADAVAVVDGVIAAVGSDAEASAAAGRGAESVPLDGAIVLPGFIDAHVHPRMGGAELLECALADVNDLPSYREAIREYADHLPMDGWVTGGGWSMSAFERGVPRADQLDDVTGGRPAVLSNRDHHSVWVNRAALAVAGLDRATPDPPGGRIERDADGTPSGALHESAQDLVLDLVPPRGPDHAVDALRAGVRFLNHLGITGWQDAKVGGDDVRAYRALQEAGELTARVAGAFWLDPEAGPAQVDDLIAAREALPVGGFRLTSAKIMLDGVCETHTAALSEPYRDGHGHATDDTGIRFWDTGELVETLRRLLVAGVQPHFHAVGDAAVTQALDAVAALLPARPLRPHVAHVQVVREADVARFRALGVSVNAQPLWARLEPQMTELTLPFLPESLARRQYPFGDFDRAGTTLAFGSDWPVSTPDPIRILHVAVNRTPVPAASTWRPEDGAFLPDQRVTLTEGLRAATAGSAWINQDETSSGRIAPGFAADFAVVDRNPFDHPADEIWRTSVVATWQAGSPLPTAP